MVLQKRSHTSLSCSTQTTACLPYGGDGRPSPSYRLSPSTMLGAGKLSPTFFGSPMSPKSYGKNSFFPNYSIDLFKTNICNILTCIVCCFSLCIFIVMSSSLREMKEEIVSTEHDFTALQSSQKGTLRSLHSYNGLLSSFEGKIQSWEEKNAMLQRELDGENPERPKTNTMMAAYEIRNLMVRREAALKSKVEYLQSEIQDISRREAMERFGCGPHLVQFHVQIGGDIKHKHDVANFTVKLAPLEMMPYSVHHFLQMVSHGLWDDTIFLHSAEHVLQAAQVNSKGESVRSRFESANLSAIKFQEYSQEFPHEKYTIGFAGRPGGPDFYISTLDNTEAHGPGGQAHHELPEEADPCFGKVVDGFDVVDRMYHLSMEDDRIHVVDTDRVLVTRIVSVKVIGLED